MLYSISMAHIRVFIKTVILIEFWQKGIHGYPLYLAYDCESLILQMVKKIVKKMSIHLSLIYPQNYSCHCLVLHQKKIILISPSQNLLGISLCTIIVFSS